MMKTIQSDFGVLILTHGRPDNVATYDALRKYGYTGKVYLVIDDEDATANEYKERYGDQVVVFSKSGIGEKLDMGDNFNVRATITFARSASFEVARSLGLKYFIQLDDDYTDFRYTEDRDGNYYRKHKIKNLDGIFACLLEFLKSTSVLSIAMSQGGDFIGGEGAKMFKEKFLRKCMNSFVCSVDREFHFMGTGNEDVNTITTMTQRGELFFTTSLARLEQAPTQSNDGGISEFYRKFGTYVKSFYSVMYNPSAVDVRFMKSRLHHHVDWKYTAPKILSERHRKLSQINKETS